jgi:hypothetical protein
MRFKTAGAGTKISQRKMAKQARSRSIFRELSTEMPDVPYFVHNLTGTRIYSYIHFLAKLIILSTGFYEINYLSSAG